MKYQVNIGRVVVDRSAGSAASPAPVQRPSQDAARRIHAAAPALRTTDLDGRIADAIRQAMATRTRP